MRIKADARLPRGRAGKACFHTIFDRAPDAIALIDRQTRALVLANPAFFRMTGYVPGDAGVNDIGQILALTAPVQTATALASGMPVRCKDGHTLLADVSASWLQMGGIAYLLCMLRDATARKAADDRMRQAAIVFEHTQDGVVVIDTEARIVAVNRAFTKITGYTKAELLQQNPFTMQSGNRGHLFYQDIWPKLAEANGWTGEIWSRSKGGKMHPAWLSISVVRNALGKVTHYIGVLTDLTHMRRARKALDQLAHYDPLTGLANRQHLEGRLAAMMARRARPCIGVMLMDLDRFQQVNDSFGLSAGDALLKQVADRIRTCVQAEGVCARLSGDEIALAVEVADVSGLAAMAERIHHSLASPFAVGEREVFLTVCIGISVYPENGGDAATLIKNADVAVHRAKVQGYGQTGFYSEVFSHRAAERLALETGLRHALERDELELHYQPQVDLATQRPVALEALVRWRHPEHGLVLPDRFIPQAEASGLIDRIDAWVLRQACRQMAEWCGQGMAPLRLAINLSARQFARVGLLADIDGILVEAALAPSILELEITENTLMEDASAAERVMEALARKQVGLAIDDFGTGYSSLAYLQRFHAHRLKIDRSFVRRLPDDAGDAALCHAIIRMAGALGLQVVAEGIETDGQRRFLADAGCPVGQGWLFAAAMPAASMARWLAQHT